MTHLKLSSTIFFAILVVFASQQNCNARGQGKVIPEPAIEYRLSDFSNFGSNIEITGPARIIEHDGRKGINLTSIHSALEMKAHNLKETNGTVTLWVMPLEDLSAYEIRLDQFRKSNPHFRNYPILSDNPNPQNYDDANFKLIWRPGFHPSIIAQFAKGNYYEQAFRYPHRAKIAVSHFVFHARKWYQFALTWDYEKDVYNLYVNGILIGREDQYKLNKHYRDEVGPSLYTGNPALCYSEIKFYDEVLSEEQVEKSFQNEVTQIDHELQEELSYTYEGKNSKKFNWKPGENWKLKFNIPFDKPADLDSFYVQGNPVKVEVIDEGLLIETVNKEYTGALKDSQVYVWTNKPFEGDLYVEFEYKVKKRGGLSLLMFQAAGMNREDFMADYPLRTNGTMVTVFGEDVRNYHWEYYREMADMRNDVDNSALMKNPFTYPVSFRSLDEPTELDTWHKLQLLQIGNKIIGAVDGIVMVEFEDDGFVHSGPVYDFGRIAIRCMLRTKMVFRNLKVYNRGKVRTVKTIPNF